MTLDERTELENLLQALVARHGLVALATEALRKAEQNRHDAHHAVLDWVNARNARSAFGTATLAPPPEHPVGCACVDCAYPYRPHSAECMCMQCERIRRNVGNTSVSVEAS